MIRRVAWGAGAALIAFFGAQYVDTQINHRPGCSRFTPEKGLFVIAHAGGGTKSARYPNSIAAMDENYARGHRVFEVDIRRSLSGKLVLGHDTLDTLWPGVSSWADVIDWMKHHPDAQIITDVKDDNIGVLRDISDSAGPLRARIIPQFYQPSEFEPISKLDFHAPIFTLYRNTDPNWRDFARKTDLMAVTVPIAKWEMAKGVGHPIFVHTVNSRKLVPTEVKGVYSDCFVPNLSIQG